eukprot:CAMPEP_0177687802 /NCGR_PEP_ID=MMETSP0447-20121125/34330_1 /TAXON_ID=0 /ORGANISM="Stygamoeba regulata, Strain BSH-02190019" /LENGTH=199 /DNA_ID=CAMNT_0019198083 /DNA_START=343 /DNA_END=939 /DNA_ORIENTATION=-
MPILWKRLDEDTKNWRQIYKALLVFDYLIRYGSEGVVKECQMRVVAIKTHTLFTFVKKDKDEGRNVRERAKAIVDLLESNDRIHEARQRGKEFQSRKGAAIEGGAAPQRSNATGEKASQLDVSGGDPASPRSAKSAHAAEKAEPIAVLPPPQAKRRGTRPDAMTSPRNRAGTSGSDMGTQASPRTPRTPRTDEARRAAE